MSLLAMLGLVSIGLALIYIIVLNLILNAGRPKREGKKMKMGTKTLLFGVHQFILHPLLVLVAWIVLYRSFPSFKELICIIIHDWGYWGVSDLKGEEGDRHPELGARLAGKWFGPEWASFILGHSTFYIARKGQDIDLSFTYKKRETTLFANVASSKLMGPDKYWHCIVPLWIYKCMAIPSGEWKYYRNLEHARQVAGRHESDLVWWLRLRKVCIEKVLGEYEIDMDNIAKEE